MPRNWSSGVNDAEQRRRFERREERRRQREESIAGARGATRQERRANETPEERERRRFWRVHDEVADIWPIEAGEQRHDITSTYGQSLVEYTRRAQEVAAANLLNAIFADPISERDEVDPETVAFIAQINSLRTPANAVVFTDTIERQRLLDSYFDWTYVYRITDLTTLRACEPKQIFIDPLCIPHLTDEQWHAVWDRIKTPEMGFIEEEEEPTMRVSDLDAPLIGDHYRQSGEDIFVYDGDRWLRVRDIQPIVYSSLLERRNRINRRNFIIEHGGGRLIFDGTYWSVPADRRPR